MFKQMWENSKIWSTIGKLTSIFTLIALVSGFFYWLIKPKDHPNLETTIYKYDYYYPADMEDKISKYRGLLDTDNLEKKLNAFIEKDKKLENYDIYKLSSSLNSYLEDIWPWESVYNIPAYKSFCTMVIENKSLKQADNVVIDLPFTDGIAQIFSEDKNKVTITFDKSIKLGEIRPLKYMVVRLWTNYEVSDSREDEIKVTHQSGISDIIFAQETVGMFDAFKKYLGVFWLPSLFLIVYCFGMICVIAIDYKKRFKSAWKIIEGLANCPSLPTDCPIKTYATPNANTECSCNESSSGDGSATDHPGDKNIDE